MPSAEWHPKPLMCTHRPWTEAGRIVSTPISSDLALELRNAVDVLFIALLHTCPAVCDHVKRMQVASMTSITKMGRGSVRR